MSDYLLSDFLHMQWLRPENAVWEHVAAGLIGRELLADPDAPLLEVGIGNGYFSFMALGGRFSAGYDWFHDVDLGGGDMFDHFSAADLARHVLQPPRRRIQLAVDHKANLLRHAEALGLVERTLVADANAEFDSGGAALIYSNILYWLRAPLEVIRRLADRLPGGGRMVLVFPNPDFYRYCQSYRGETPFWRHLNRGRAGHIMWHMDLGAFERETAAMGLRLRDARRYLSERTLRIWDVGLRPLAPQLIRMANRLPPEERLAVKEEWCATLMELLPELLEEELREGPVHGGFNFVVLEKS